MAITSWTSEGMNWDDPDLSQIYNYLEAIRLAIIERHRASAYCVYGNRMTGSDIIGYLYSGWFPPLYSSPLDFINSNRNLQSIVTNYLVDYVNRLLIGDYLLNYSVMYTIDGGNFDNRLYFSSGGTSVNPIPTWNYNVYKNDGSQVYRGYTYNLLNQIGWTGYIPYAFPPKENSLLFSTAEQIKDGLKLCYKILNQLRWFTNNAYYGGNIGSFALKKIEASAYRPMWLYGHEHKGNKYVNGTEYYEYYDLLGTKVHDCSTDVSTAYGEGGEGIETTPSTYSCISELGGTDPDYPGQGGSGYCYGSMVGGKMTVSINKRMPFKADADLYVGMTQVYTSRGEDYKEKYYPDFEFRDAFIKKIATFSENGSDTDPITFDLFDFGPPASPPFIYDESTHTVSTSQGGYYNINPTIIRVVYKPDFAFKDW